MRSMGASSSDPPMVPMRKPTVRRNPSWDDLEKVRHTPVHTPVPTKCVTISRGCSNSRATLVDIASGDRAHGDFMHDSVSDVIDRAGRRCCYFWTGRLGVTPDECTEAAKACRLHCCCGTRTSHHTQAVTIITITVLLGIVFTSHCQSNQVISGCTRASRMLDLPSLPTIRL
jgi:hypothetical protein